MSTSRADAYRSCGSFAPIRHRSRRSRSERLAERRRRDAANLPLRHHLRSQARERHFTGEQDSRTSSRGRTRRCGRPSRIPTPVRAAMWAISSAYSLVLIRLVTRDHGFSSMCVSPRSISFTRRSGITRGSRLHVAVNETALVRGVQPDGRLRDHLRGRVRERAVPSRPRPCRASGPGTYSETTKCVPCQ